jgi:hypothetical protein
MEADIIEIAVPIVYDIEMSSASSRSQHALSSPMIPATDLQFRDTTMHDDYASQLLEAATGVLPKASNDPMETNEEDETPVITTGDDPGPESILLLPLQEPVPQSIIPTENEARESSNAPNSMTTEVLRPHKQITPQDTDDLVNTIQTIFEEDSTVRENGVLLLDAPFLVPAAGDIVLPPPDYSFEATSQRIMTPAKHHGKGLVVIKHEVAELKKRKPNFAPCKELTPDEMEVVFRTHIEDHKNQSRHPYFNIDISEYNVRPKGSFELTCGSPMDKLSYIAGVNTPYGYYSRNISHFGAHVEDWHFASYNILFAGATKLWIAVKPSSQQLLESKIRELFPDSGECVQFMRHQALNLAPSTLRKWGVEHFFVPQKPGQVVAVSGFTYHWGINTGHNYAEAINFCLEKDWKASENFKNCYPGCGINEDTSMPLPMPVPEEGTLEEKKARAIMRDEGFLEIWQKRVGERNAELGLDDEPVRKSVPKKPRASTARPRSEATESQRQSAHRGEVSRAAQQLNGRSYRRQMTSQRNAYAAVDSSPSEAGSTDEDDNPPTQRMRHIKPSHSRNNSGHLFLAQQPDMTAILTEMRTFKGYFMEQKKATAKNEEMLQKQLHYQKKQSDDMREQLYYQKKQSEDMREQLDTTKKMLQIMLGMDHRMMLSSQRAETRSMLIGSHQSSNAPSEVYAPSAASAPAGLGFGQQPNRHAAAMLAHASQSAPDSSRSQANGQSQFRVHQAPLPEPPQHHRRQKSAQEHITRTAFHTVDKPALRQPASSQTSRRPSAVELSEHSSEHGTHPSSAFSPITPHVESMHSTPQAELETASSAPSSLSEQGSDENTILVKTKPTKSATRRVVTEVTEEEEDEEMPSTPSSDSEYTERPQRKQKTPRGTSSLAARSSSKSPTSSSNTPESVVVPKVSKASALKRAVDEAGSTTAGKAKRAKADQLDAITDEIQQHTVHAKGGAADSRRQSVQGLSMREVVSLGATSEWSGSQLPEPGSRRPKSKPLGS